MAAIVDPDKCDGCGACVDVCPMEAIEIVDDKAIIDEDECGDCGACVDECPTEAITLPD